jgi:hypothetical protein
MLSFADKHANGAAAFELPRPLTQINDGAG